MDSSTAERWVVISAATTAGVYAYRRVTDPTTSSKVTVKDLTGLGDPPPVGAFITAWGFTFLVVSIMATANPELGAAFAMLIATADFLANAPALFGASGSVTKAVTATAPAKPTPTTKVTTK